MPQSTCLPGQYTLNGAEGPFRKLVVSQAGRGCGGMGRYVKEVQRDGDYVSYVFP